MHLDWEEFVFCWGLLYERIFNNALFITIDEGAFFSMEKKSRGPKGLSHSVGDHGMLVCTMQYMHNFSCNCSTSWRFPTTSCKCIADLTDKNILKKMCSVFLHSNWLGTIHILAHCTLTGVGGTMHLSGYGHSVYNDLSGYPPTQRLMHTSWRRVLFVCCFTIWKSNKQTKILSNFTIKRHFPKS